MKQKLIHLVNWLFVPSHYFVSLLATIPVLFMVIFVFFHRQNFPRNEAFAYTYPMVVAYQDRGQIDFSLLFQRVGGLHLTVFPLMLTYASVLLARWNVDFELAIMFWFVVGIYLMLVALFYRTEPTAALWILIPFSMVVFSVHQDINLYIGYYAGTWFLPVFFFLMGLCLVEWYPGRWWSLVLAAIAAACSMLSHLSGAASWAAIGIYLPFSGFRQRRYFVFWLLSALLTTSGYLYEPLTMGMHSQNAETSVSLYAPAYQTYFFLVRLGAMFVSRFYFHPASAVIGIIGLLVLIPNLMMLRGVTNGLRASARWLAVASYGIGVAGLISLNPTRTADTIYRAFLSYYDTGVGIFWIGFIAVTVLGVYYLIRPHNLRFGGNKVLLYLDLSVLAMLFGLYILQNQRIELTSYTSVYTRNTATGTPVTASCATTYVFTLDGSCLKEYVEVANELAVRHVALYANLQPKHIMPSEYKSGQPIVLATSDAESASVARNWVLAEIPDENLVYWFGGRLPPGNVLPKPPHPAFDSMLPTSVEDTLHYLKEPRELWLVYPATQTIPAQLLTELARGYLERERFDGAWIIIHLVKNS